MKYSKTIKIVTTLLALLSVTACVNTHPYQYKYDKQLLQTNNKVMVLVPFNAERDSLPLPEDAANLVLSSVKQKFESDGWTVLQGEDISDTWQQAYTQLKESTGLYDSQTGQYKTAEINKIEHGITSQILKDTAANFVLIPRILVSTAQVQSDTAGWHGTTEQSSSFWNNVLSNTTMVRASIPASSLQIQLYNQDGIVYEHRGGIELVSKINKLSSTFEVKDKHFQDPKKIKKALEIVLEPLFAAK